MQEFHFKIRKYANTRAQDQGKPPKFVHTDSVRAATQAEAWARIAKLYPANRAHSIEQVSP
jgi:hypothetical protein